MRSIGQVSSLLRGGTVTPAAPPRQGMLGAEMVFSGVNR
jgi:hypothetical protein